jgi:exopolysaccharide biosynthesis polyprenyl glycosylphosphotransferase
VTARGRTQPDELGLVDETDAVGAPEKSAGSVAATKALTEDQRARRSLRAALLHGRGWNWLSVSSDALMLVLAVAAALIGANAAHVRVESSAIVWAFPPLVIALLALRGMYRQKIQLRVLDEAGHVVGATSVAAMIVIAVGALSTGATGHAELIARVWVLGMLYVGGSRAVLSVTQRQARVKGIVGERTLIIGAGRVGAQVEHRLQDAPELGLRPVGYIDAYPPADDLVPERSLPVLGGPAELARIVEETQSTHVVLAFLSARGSDARMVPIVRECEELGLNVSLVPRLFENMNVRVAMEHVGGMPRLRLRSVKPKGWQFAIKDAIDRVAAAFLIVTLSPLLIATTLAVRLSSPGPIFFRQRRVGRDGRVFELLKFRSMRPSPNDAATTNMSNVTVLLPEDTAPGGVEGADRRTRVGRFIRSTSIDELPQLFNVLRGDMSIVGPRPERPEFVELFERRVARYDDRHRVKSGITGWAQVHGLRGKTSLADRIEWDNYYIENWSLALDLKVVLMTVVAVFKAAE